jgi:hypothetical protein
MGAAEETLTNPVSGCLGRGTDVSVEPAAAILILDEGAVQGTMLGSLERWSKIEVTSEPIRA